MKPPRRRRSAPKRNGFGTAPVETNVQDVADRARYVGSSEHKDVPSFAGEPRPRADATICDPRFIQRRDEIEKWLKVEIRNGQLSAYWEHGFPRYVGHRDGQAVYIARHVGNGCYKGWQLDDPDDWPQELR